MLEPLEPRLLLSAVQWLAGLSGPENFPDHARGQIVYLDGDGAHSVTYDGPVTVQRIDVPAFSADGVGLGGQEHRLVEAIAQQVAHRLSPFGVTVTASKPQVLEYSTLYLGGSGEFVSAWGDFTGLAESVDVGNANRRDEGFVFTDRLACPDASPEDYCRAVAAVAVHEIGHLLGLAHAAEAHEAGRLAQVAHQRDTGSEVHQWLTIEGYAFYDAQFPGSELEDYVGHGSPAQWLGNSTSDHGNSNILEGTYDEDNGVNWMQHFVQGADGEELYIGFASDTWDSAYERAAVTDNFWGSAVGAYGSNKREAYYTLGRVIHLLEDLTVPAHVHNDAHPFYDTYEFEVGDTSSFDGENVRFTNYTSADARGDVRTYGGIEAIFRETANYTEDYDSDEGQGDWNNGSQSFSAARLAELALADRHRPDRVDTDNGGGTFPWYAGISGSELLVMADDLMPWAIEQVAALFRLFYSEADATGPVVSPADGLSDDVNHPTRRTTPSFPVSCDPASDPESGVDSDGYRFLTRRWLDSGWGDWTDWGHSQRTRTLGAFDDGLYAIRVAAENGGGKTGSSAIRYVRVDTTPPTLDGWSAAAEHGGTELLLAIPDDGSFSEPRADGITTLVLAFSEAVDLSAAAVTLAGSPPGVEAIVSHRTPDTGRVVFNQTLPDAGRYLVAVHGVTDEAGNALVGDADRVMTALAGDADGNLATDVFDASAAWSLRGQSPGAGQVQARADVNTDGLLDVLDAAAVWSCCGHDTTHLPDPAGQARGSQSPGLTAAPLAGAALYADVALTTPGLVGTYVDTPLSHVTGSEDWRVTQPVAGTRLDDSVEFLADGWGARAAVGLTAGSDENWEAFSVQWDGYLEVDQAGRRFATVSDDASRFWIDLDRDGVFEASELTDNTWGGTQGASIGDRTAGLPAGVYPIRIQYYEVSGGNSFSFAASPYVPAQFVPTADNPQQIVRAIVLSFDPRVPGEQNRLMHEVFGWNDPHDLAVQFEADLEWATGGAIDIQIAAWRDLDAFPTFTDGFRYNPDQYVANRRAGSGWHAGGTDFYELIESQGLLDLVNAGQVDEIWLFGDHYFSLLGEAWMGGPNAFFINGPTFPDAGFDRAIAGYGFNYERGVAEMIHDLCHRTENHGQRAFGPWNLAYPDSAFDAFSSNLLDTASGPYGVGSCHVPANADAHYDYGDPRTVESFAFDFANYPAMTWQTQPLSRDTWLMGSAPDDHRDYMNWYFSMVPRNDGTDADGRAANWFKYIWDFNSYASGTGLGRQEDAYAAGPIVRAPGPAAYDLTVRYYDGTGVDADTLDTDDVRVIAPGGAVLVPTTVDPGVEVPTTAGTARSVAYRITPPGGAWDPGDNGTYRIELQPGQVLDADANAFAGGQVGSFRVALYDPAAINVSALLAAGQATATHSTFDIGTIENLFDGNTTTLARTAAVNPAEVTLEFDAPQTVAGFRSYFAAAWGDPAYEYVIEAADTRADLDGRTGSYMQLVPVTGTPSDTWSAVTLATAHTARVFRLTATRLTGDDYVHINAWQFVGTGAGETDAPTAVLAAVDEAQMGATAHFLDVTFADATGVDVPSIANGDLVITGPGDVTVTPTFYDVDDYANPSTCTATFWFIPPGGAWDDLDNGTYTIALEAGAVRDLLYNAADAPQTLGTFDVFIAPPQTRPPADLAENNADQWIAWADGASAWTADDTSRTVAGEASVRFQTDGGFDTSLTFPGPGRAEWDLTAATRLAFSIYAENPSPFNFQEGPWVRLHGVEGGYFEYRYYENGNPATPLNGALDQWAQFTMPLDPPVQPTGWRRTTVGEPTFESIASVAFHADTWDAGFVLWYDAVGFDLPVTSAAPTQVALLPASDTGVSSTDNLTMLDNSDAGKTLQFEVRGTVDQAVVAVYADDVEIGRSPAGAGDTTVVVTNGQVDLADGTHAITARQTEPGLDESGDSPALDVTVDTEAPASGLWSSAAEHDGTELLLLIPDDGSFSEPRAGGITTLVLAFSEPVNLSAAAVTLGGSPPGIEATVSHRTPDTGRVVFSQALPDVGRYLVAVHDVTDLAGNASVGDADRVMTALAGDVDGTLATDVFDASAAWSLRGQSPGAGQAQARADVNTDGVLDVLDAAAVWLHGGHDATGLPDPAGQAQGSQSSGLTVAQSCGHIPPRDSTVTPRSGGPAGLPHDPRSRDDLDVRPDTGRRFARNAATDPVGLAQLERALLDLPDVPLGGGFGHHDRVGQFDDDGFAAQASNEDIERPGLRIEVRPDRHPALGVIGAAEDSPGGVSLEQGIVVVLFDGLEDLGRRGRG